MKKRTFQDRGTVHVPLDCNRRRSNDAVVRSNINQASDMMIVVVDDPGRFVFSQAKNFKAREILGRLARSRAPDAPQKFEKREGEHIMRT
jgi:hypothetical protein